MDATSKTGVAQPHRGCTICANCRLQLCFLVAHRLRGKPPTVENMRSRIQGKLPSGGGRLLLGFPDCLSTEPQCGIERDFVQEKSRYAFPFFGRSIGFLLLAKRQSRRVYNSFCGQPECSCSSTSMRGNRLLRGSRLRKYASAHFSFRRPLPAARFDMCTSTVCCNCIWLVCASS